MPQIKKPSYQDLYFTRTSMEKLRVLHPRCGIQGARSIYDEGELLTSKEAAAIGLNQDNKHPETLYIADADCDGVFVVAPSFGDRPHISPFTVVTYRRFNRQERATCMDVLDERDDVEKRAA